jgi:hypothetical protein
MVEVTTGNVVNMSLTRHKALFSFVFGLTAIKYFLALQKAAQYFTFSQFLFIQVTQFLLGRLKLAHCLNQL